MIRVFCDSCKGGDEGAALVCIEVGGGNSRRLHLCRDCIGKLEGVFKTDDGIEDPADVFASLLLEAIGLKIGGIVVPLPVVGVQDNTPDMPANATDSTEGDPQLITEVPAVPVVPVPVVVPSASDLHGAECRCGGALTPENWCEGNLCPKCFKSDLESLPAEVEVPA